MTEPEHKPEAVLSPEERKRKKIMLIYRFVLILLIFSLLCYSIFLILRKDSGAWLAQKGSWVATYETGKLDLELSTNGKKRGEEQINQLVSLRLPGGTKFNSGSDVVSVTGFSDREFNQMVLPVEIHMENTGTVDLAAKIKLTIPAIGEEPGSTPTGILYMVLPMEEAFPETGQGAEVPDYRAYIAQKLNLSDTSTGSTYDSLRTQLNAYNQTQLKAIAQSDTVLRAPVPAKGETPAQPGESQSVRFLFWADYDTMLKYFFKDQTNLSDTASRDQAVKQEMDHLYSAWYEFKVRVDVRQKKAPAETQGTTAAP